MSPKNFKATNTDIAKAFAKIAEILEIQGANMFRIRAYSRAAESVQGLAKDAGDIYNEGGLKAVEDVPGIGKDLALKIEEMLLHGKMTALKELEKEVPVGILEIMNVEGMGPKKTKFVWKKFDVKNVADLEKLCKSGKLTELKGWGERSVANILKGIEIMKKFGERVPIAVAMNMAEAIVAILNKSKLCKNVEIAGSLRRGRDTIGDIDILVTSEHPEEVMDIFTTMPYVQDIIVKGPTKSTVLLKSGLEADVRVLEPELFGAGLYYFTGSKEHHIETRTMAVKKGITISEYGVYKGTKEKKGKMLAAKTEKDVFESIGLPYIPPEIREGRGELEAALAGKLPVLVEAKDIKGDLHVHSNFSDGMEKMEDIAKAAKANGLEYFAFTDHASPMGMVKGIKKENIKQYLKMIEYVRKAVPGIKILAGTEVDILEDGSLYLPDDILKELDWVVASVHSNFKQGKEVMTKRLISAMNNPYVKMIGHPTTRLLGSRAPIEIDFEEILQAAKNRGVALEISALTERLDLDDIHAKMAKEAGVLLAISSDAHVISQLSLRYGIIQARRGWCEKGDIINTLSFEKFCAKFNIKG